MELAVWAKDVVDKGERTVDVKDFMLDMHTHRGAEMGRGTEQWWSEGAHLVNEVGGFETKWGDYLRKHYGGKSAAEDQG